MEYVPPIRRRYLPKTNQMKKIKITFIKSPTGAFNLAYSIGDTVEMEAEQAREMMEANFAVPAKEGKPSDQKQTATAKTKGKENRAQK